MATPASVLLTSPSGGRSAAACAMHRWLSAANSRRAGEPRSRASATVGSVAPSTATRMIICMADRPAHGVAPERSSHRMTPSENTSALAALAEPSPSPAPAPRNTSGAAHAAAPVLDEMCPSRLDNPKSHNTMDQ